MKHLKRTASAALCAAALCLSGCGAFGKVSSAKEEFGSKSDEFYERNNPKKLARKEAEQLFEYLKNEDIDSLIELFPEAVRSAHDLEAEWQAFFERIDGKLISYDGISFGAEEKSVKDGELYYSTLVVDFNNVATDTGAVYKVMGYQQTRVNTADPEAEGINVFELAFFGDNDMIDEVVAVGGIVPD